MQSDRSPTTSRTLRRLAFAAGLLMAGAICLPATAAVDDPTTLTVATMWESLPHSMQARRSRFFNESEILDTLVKLDYDLKPVPGLALSWERSGDNEWKFRLRDGVAFMTAPNSPPRRWCSR